MKLLLPSVLAFFALSLPSQAQTPSLSAALTCPPVVSEDMSVDPSLPQCFVLSQNIATPGAPIGNVTPVIEFDRRCPFGRSCLVSGPVQIKVSVPDDMGDLTPIATLGMGDGTLQKFTDMGETFKIELLDVSPNVFDTPQYTLQFKVASNMDMLQ